MMVSRDDLVKALQTLTIYGESCPTHGDEDLEMCPDCWSRYSIQCGKCEVHGCYCTRDD